MTWGCAAGSGERLIVIRTKRRLVFRRPQFTLLPCEQHQVPRSALDPSN